ncbi:MAG: ribonuclease III [Okeania sp. SIO2F4]|nr:ribonuclease III [Okeania sp. SIO2F4]
MTIFKNQELLTQALNHRSYLNENYEDGDEEDNESLEFLGDAVLGFLVGELLYRRYKEDHNLKPKKLTRLRSLLVDEKQLAKFAVQLRIGKKMRLGKGAKKDGGRQNPALLSDIFEAIIGAYFIDSNLMNLRSFVNKIFQPVADYLMSLDNDLVDTKAKFQQWALEKIEQIPKYESNKCGGSDNKPNFLSRVFVANRMYGEGKSRSKKYPEKLAAENALAKLKQEGLI